MATTVNTADLELGGIGEYRTGAFSPKEVRLIPSTNLFRVSKDGTVSVNDITLTLQRVYVTGTATFTTTPSVTLTGSGDTRTLSYANLGANNTVVVTVSVTDSADGTVYSDNVTLAKVLDGSDSLTVVLSNEACSVPGNALGQTASFAGTGTTIEVYEGSQKLTYVTGSLTNSSFSIATAVSPVAKITVGTITGANTTTATVANHSALADDTDLVAITYTISAKRSNGTTSTLTATQSITKTRSGLNFSDAKVLFTDTAFATGLNSVAVYNNSGGGTVTVTREAAQADSPFINVSGFNIKVSNTGTASPGIGGFVHSTTSRANAVFAQRVIAKIPVGYTLQWASNAIGDSSTQRWITSQAGTGNFEEYIVIRKCGATGTFSTTGHLYLTGTVGTPAAPVNWYLAYATVYDFTAPANLLTSARLTKDSVTVPADSSGTVSDFTAATTTFRVYNGATDDTANWTITVTPGTGVTGTASGSPANSTYTLTGLSQDTGTVTFTASRSGYSSLTSTFTVVKARAGIGGTNAAYVVVNSTQGQAFKFASGASTPTNGNSLIFTATLNGGLSAYQWQYYNGTAWTNFSAATSSSFTLAYNDAAWGSAVALNIRCLSGSQSDEVTVVKLSDGTNGSPGSNGTNTATVTLYAKNTSSSTAPATFSGTFTYTFSTAALSGGTLNTWSITAPSISNGEYLWARYAVAASNTATDTIDTAEFSSAVVVGIGGTNGSPGSNGTNTATVTLYAKNTSSSTAPATFSGTFTYTFSTAALSGGTLNTWSITAPSISNGEYLWARYAVAASNTATDTIDTAEFSSAVVVGIGGTNGSPGVNAVTGYLTNESHTIPADNAGTVQSGDYAAAGGTFKVYNGITDVTTSSTFSVVGTPTGITASIGAATGVYTLSNMTVNSTTVTFRATYSGTTIDKVYSISKSRTGSSGQRGSVSFDIATTQTTWNATVESAIDTYYANNYSSTKVLNDRVTAYNTSAGFSQTRYWSGSAWIQAASVVDGNLIVTGTVTGDKLVTNSITTNKLLVTGQGAALNNDPSTQDITAWTSDGSGSYSLVTVSDGVVGDKALQGVNGPHLFSNFIPVDATKKYRVRCRARRSSDATGTFYLRLYQYTATGTFTGTYFAGFENVSVTTAWQTFTSSAITLGSTAAFAKVVVILNYGSAIGYMQAQDIRCEEVIGGDLIVDGSLTADKIDSRGLSIKRPDGSIILQAGSSGSVLDYSNVGGSSRPADNANNTYIDSTGNIQGVSSGSNQSVANNVDSVIRSPAGGVYTTQTTTVTGAIKIRLPQYFTNTMMRFTVEVYEYSTGYMCTLEIGGYNYLPNLSWINVSARVIGGSNVEYPVYFGHDGTKCCVWIGVYNETWNYPQVRVRDFFAGYSNFSANSWSTGWQISFDQTQIASGTATNQYSASVTDTFPGADWSKTARRPTNLSSLSGTENIQNSQISISSGAIQGIGTGDGTTVDNNSIAVNGSGQITGIGTGANTTVANNQISVNAAGNIGGIGTGDGQSVANNTNSRIMVPDGGIFTSTSPSISGAVRIRLPARVNTDYPMVKFTVEIYEYIYGYSTTMSVSGHTSGTGWYNVSAQLVAGNIEYPVSFGHDGTYFVVWIGTNSETWTYPQVFISNVLVGYTSMSASLWSSNWAISFDIAAATNVTGTVSDTYPAADWSKTARRPANLAALAGNEGIQNGLITLSSNGTLQNAGGGQITTLTASDTRNTNQPPSWYSVGVTEEFKSRTAIGAPGVSTYGILRTEKGWADSSGGAVIQTFKTQESEYKRTSVNGNYSQWNGWTPKIDQKIDPSNIARFMEPDSIDSTYIGTNLQSTNYVANTTGWKIVKDTGTAEFSNVLVRGTVYATSGTFSGSLNGATGTFSGTVAAGSINVDALSGTTLVYNSGSYNVTIPAGMTQLKVTLIGGGGGGGGYANNASGAGGGGGGGLVVGGPYTVTPGNILTLVVGYGGGVGGGGGSTYVSGYASAGGGGGGSGLSGGAGGTGTTYGAAGANGAAQQTGTDAYNNTYEISPAVFGAGGISGGNYGGGGAGATNQPGGAGGIYGGGGGGGNVGAGGRAILEFSNPNGVIKRSEWDVLIAALLRQNIQVV